jgi:RHS repeat-associated protein
LTITDASGSIRSTSTNDTRYTYTGREWDADLNLYHFRARIYDAKAGRFCGRDPLGFPDGSNQYTWYAILSGSDPFGLYTIGPTSVGECRDAYTKALKRCDELPWYDIFGKWKCQDIMIQAHLNCIQMVRGLDTDVKVCCVDLGLLPPVVRETVGSCGLQHCWLKTQEKEGGLYAHPDDQTENGGLPMSPCYGTRTVIWDHKGWTEKYDAKCTAVPGCDAKCVNDQLEFNKDMGDWSAKYNCKSFVHEVLDRCNCHVRGQHSAIPESKVW